MSATLLSFVVVLVAVVGFAASDSRESLIFCSLQLFCVLLAEALRLAGADVLFSFRGGGGGGGGVRNCVTFVIAQYR